MSFFQQHSIAPPGWEYELDEPTMSAPPARFAIPVTDDEVEKAKESAIPEKTRKDTEWCMRIWQQWRSQRESSSQAVTIPPIISIDKDQLQYWLCRFVLEVRKVKGECYPPETVLPYKSFASCYYCYKAVSSRHRRAADYVKNRAQES